jgi:hypothetical protein
MPAVRAVHYEHCHAAQTFPRSEAMKAQEQVATGHTRGKIILKSPTNRSSRSENIAVMLSEALQQNAKHEARLSNISDRSG